jgi:hypothetical protein
MFLNSGARSSTRYLLRRKAILVASTPTSCGRSDSCSWPREVDQEALRRVKLGSFQSRGAKFRCSGIEPDPPTIEEQATLRRDRLAKRQGNLRECAPGCHLTGRSRSWAASSMRFAWTIAASSHPESLPTIMARRAAVQMHAAAPGNLDDMPSRLCVLGELRNGREVKVQLLKGIRSASAEIFWPEIGMGAARIRAGIESALAMSQGALSHTTSSRALSGEVDPVHRQKTRHTESSRRFHVSGNSSRRVCPCFPKTGNPLRFRQQGK